MRRVGLRGLENALFWRVRFRCWIELRLIGVRARSGRPNVGLAQPAGCEFDRLDDLSIARAAADISRDSLDDILSREGASLCASNACAVSTMPGVQ